jgi:hypothetical protein
MKTTKLITGLSLMLFLISAHPAVRFSGSMVRQINVMDFGARPNDGKDDSKAISRAIDFCKSKPGLTLYFPYGQYDLKSDKALEAWQNMITSAIPGKERWMGPPPKGLEGWPTDKNVVLKIEDCSDLIIDGNGSLLMVHGLCQPFKIVNCNNLGVRNFRIDYIQPPNMTAKIIGLGEKNIDVEVLDNVPVKGGEPFIALQMYDSLTRLPTSVETFAGVKSTELIGPKLLRLNMTNDDRGSGFPRRLTVGNLLVMRQILGGYEPFEINDGDRILLENIAIYAGAGMGIVAIGVRDLTLKQVKIMPEPGTSRLMSITADGTHFIGCRGTVILENCTIMGEGDDHLNLHGQYHFISKIISKRKIEARIGTLSGMGMWDDSWVKGWTSVPRTGESVEFCEKENLNIKGTAKIESFDFNRETGKSIITFDRDIPENLREEHVFQVIEQVPALRVSNCSFGFGRARGLLITTRDAIVENCTFDRVGGSPIFVCCEVDWLETPAPANIKIINNNFINCGYAVANEGAAITVLFKQGKKVAGWIKNLEISDNILSGDNRAGVLAKQVDGLLIRNNVFKGFKEAIVIGECKNVTIENNFTGGGKIKYE